jgi:hypothetical protein
MVPEGWIQIRISVTGNATRRNGDTGIERVVEIGAIPVKSTNPAPAFLELSKNLELYLAGSRTLR